MGPASYCRRFIPSFSKVAAPLFELTKKDILFQWSAECQSAFEKLKGAMTTGPVLAWFNGVFVLETDVSWVAVNKRTGQLNQFCTPAAHCSNMNGITARLSWRPWEWSGLCTTSDTTCMGIDAPTVRHSKLY
jgi:hypothetical protein